MTIKTDHHYALRCLAAADIAPSLCDQIQSIHERSLAIAREKTLEQGRALVADRLEQLPQCLGINLANDELKMLVQEMLE